MTSAAALSLPLPLDLPLALGRRGRAAGRFNAFLLVVSFEGPAGERTSAIGGGETVAEAIAAARAELPSGVDWVAAGWNDLY